MTTHTWRRRGIGAVLAAALVALPACSGDDEPTDDEAAAASDDESAPQRPPKPDTSPLTGLETKGRDPAYPVLAVKVDNTSASSPQVGVDEADLVVEELVEGGLTRLAAFYWSTTPKEVGPVRSMRATDIGLVLPLDGGVVASGGAPPTIAAFDNNEIDMYVEGDTGFFRADGRSAPYDLMVDLDELAGTVESDARPEAYFPFGEAGHDRAKPAASASVTFSSASTTEWSFSDGVYTRTDSPSSGTEFEADNVLVLHAPVLDSGNTDAAGSAVPTTFLAGQGAAELFFDGSVVEGRWTKDGLDGVLELTTRKGDPLEVAPGKTWIELIPKDGGAVSY